MKRLLTHSQLKHTKQAANKFLTCFIAAIMAVALSLPAAGIPTLSFADEPNQGSVTVTPADLEEGNGESGNGGSSSDQQGASGNAARVLHRQMILLMILQMEAMLLEMRAIPVMEPKTPILLRAAYPMGLFLRKIPTAA